MQHKTFFPKQIAIATVSALVSLHAWADDTPQAASEPGSPPRCRAEPEPANRSG